MNVTMHTITVITHVTCPIFRLEKMRYQSLVHIVTIVHCLWQEVLRTVMAKSTY